MSVADWVLDRAAGAAGRLYDATYGRMLNPAPAQAAPAPKPQRGQVWVSNPNATYGGSYQAAPATGTGGRGVLPSAVPAAGSGSFDRRTDRGAIAPKPAPAAAAPPPAVAAVADRQRADAASANHSVKPQELAVPEGYESFETYNSRPYKPSAERQAVGEDGVVSPSVPYSDFRSEQRAAFLDAEGSMDGIWAQRRMLADQAAANGHQLQAADWRNMNRKQLEKLAATRYEGGGEFDMGRVYSPDGPEPEAAGPETYTRGYELEKAGVSDFNPTTGVNIAEEGENMQFDPNVNFTGRVGDEIKNHYMQFGLRDRVKNNPDNKPLNQPVDPAQYSAAQVFRAAPQLSIRDNALASAAAVGMNYQPDANSPEVLAAANIWGSRNGKGLPSNVTALDQLDPDVLPPLNLNYRGYWRS